MGYCLIDSRGYLEDFASIGGLSNFYEWAHVQDGTIQDLMLHGHSTDLEALKISLQSAIVWPGVKEQVDLLIKYAELKRDVLIISDGLSDEPELRTLNTEYPILSAAESSEKAIQLAASVSLLLCRRAYRTNGLNAALKALKASLAKTIPSALEKAYLNGVEATKIPRLLAASSNLRTAREPLRAKFSNRTDAAKAWAEDHAGEMIMRITDTTRDEIRFIITRLLDADEDINSRDAYEEIALAIGDDDRASLIATQESITAVHEGQRDTWEAAVEEGLLSKDVKRKWIITGDDSLCDLCESLEGQIVELDEEYAPDIIGPPAHVRCRCTEGLVA